MEHHPYLDQVLKLLQASRLQSVTAALRIAVPTAPAPCHKFPPRPHQFSQDGTLTSLQLNNTSSRHSSSRACSSIAIRDSVASHKLCSRPTTMETVSREVPWMIPTYQSRELKTTRTAVAAFTQLEVTLARTPSSRSATALTDKWRISTRFAALLLFAR